MTIEEQLDSLIRDLSEATPLFIPDQYAGYLLVDPVIPAAIGYWWEEYKRELKQGFPQ